MASFPTTAAADDPLVSRGNGHSLPPGGDGGFDDDARHFESRLRRARVGLVVALIGIFMIFVSLTSAYVVRQGLPSLDPATNTLVRDWIPVRLPGLVFVNTFVLLISGISMEMARRQAAREASRGSDTSANKTDGISWLALTIVLGITFLSGQWVAWRELAATGFYLATTPSSSFFYLLTGMHGVHLIGGILALLTAGGAALLRRSAAGQAVIVDVTAWYWHFMAVLWVYIFCLLRFLR
jgi:cytochrome c oxidase subunit III